MAEILKIKFKNINLFNLVFPNNIQDIKIIGNTRKFYFRGKDVLTILNYSEGSFKQILYRVKNDYKNNLRGVIEEFNMDIIVSYNEGKEIYLNEKGLYNLILRSRIEKSRELQNYICEEFLPYMRSEIYKNDISDVKIYNMTTIIDNENNQLDIRINILN